MILIDDRHDRAEIRFKSCESEIGITGWRINEVFVAVVTWPDTSVIVELQGRTDQAGDRMESCFARSSSELDGCVGSADADCALYGVASAINIQATSAASVKNARAIPTALTFVSAARNFPLYQSVYDYC